jgi:1,4-alpha-glucan branching enzyme
MQDLVRDLNRLYRDRPALHARDCEPEGFEWLVVDDKDRFGFCLAAQGAAPAADWRGDEFHAIPREDYVLPLPKAGRWREILNTDADAYGGTGKGNLGSVQAVKKGKAITQR